MSPDIEEIKQRLRLGEDSRWEFKQIEFKGNKPVGPSRDDLADEISAFANAEGGILLCGVTDKGEVQDMSREQMDALVRLLGEVCQDAIKPPIDRQIRRRFIEDDKTIVVVEVDRGYTLHESPGGYYRRFDATKRKISSDDQLRIAQQRSQARFRWFDEQIVPGTGFHSLNEALWKPLLSLESDSDPETALGKMGLLREENGEIFATVAGVLVCSREPETWLPNACIMATRYRGVDRASEQLDAQVIMGPLGQQIRDAVDFAVRNMRVAARKTPMRVDMPQYSRKAIFEAVVNAVVHRDYSMQGSKILLRMFEDRLEIQSPGGLPNNLTTDDMAYRQATRNEALASLLRRTPATGIKGAEDKRFIMELRGDGLPIIRDETKVVSGKPPEFRLISKTELCVCLPAADIDPIPANVVITVRGGGRPLPGVDLLVLFPNKTWRQARTDENGSAAVDLYTTQLPMTVFAAAPEYAAGLERNWVPSERALALELNALPNGGSAIFPEADGHLPRFHGRLNPIRDNLDRAYLYADNISINEGMQQPVHFLLGEDLHLKDADGHSLSVRIVDIVGRSALVEYRA